VKRIYTRTGDTGETGLFGGGRVAKSDPRVAAYGEVDELNAWLGVARAHCADGSIGEALEAVQRDLFVVGAILATPDPKKRRGERWELAASRVGELEARIDAWDAELPVLDAFILPGGTPCGASLHAARTVCRRAERAIVALAADDLPEALVPYMNRLGDWLFTCARVANARHGAEEIRW